MRTLFTLFVFWGFSMSAFAVTDLECYRAPGCRGKWRNTSSSNPSTGGELKINPSAVPTEQGFGLEGILFKDEVDLSVVRGNGRVGAALSPANSDETFFGPPGFELPEKFQERKAKSKKYPTQKLTFATAMSFAEKKGAGLNNYTLKAGAMAKYNQLTRNTNFGGGVSGNLGPISFGYSVYNDETQLNYEIYGSTLKPTAKFQVESYNIGVFLHSLTIDYSQLRMQSLDPATVTLVTASLSIGRVILTASKRTDDDNRPAYDYDTKSLIVKKLKDEYFGGVQFSVNKNFQIGALYNYYLLREVSATATIFF